MAYNKELQIKLGAIVLVASGVIVLAASGVIVLVARGVMSDNDTETKISKQPTGLKLIQCQYQSIF